MWLMNVPRSLPVSIQNYGFIYTFRNIVFNYEISVISIFFKPLQSKGNYLSFYVSMCFVFGCFISCHPIQYLLSYQKEKSEGKKWHMFKFSSVISYLILVFKSYVGRGKQQVSNITLDEKQNNPKYVFNICKHQNPNLIHYILWLFYPVLIFFFFFEYSGSPDFQALIQMLNFSFQL